MSFQKEMLEKYCVIHNYNIVEIYKEDYSAKNFDDRPEFNKLMQFVKINKGLVKMILVSRWDRFSRNAPESYKVIATLRKQGIEVNAVEQPINFNIQNKN